MKEAKPKNNSMFSMIPLKSRKCKSIRDRKETTCLPEYRGLGRARQGLSRDIREQVHVHYLDCGVGFKGVYDVYGVMDVYICQELLKCIVYCMSIIT